MPKSTYAIDLPLVAAMMRACPKTEGIRPQAEGKPLRGTQHRSSGSGLVIRAVCLVGLPGGNQRFFCLAKSEPQAKQP